MKVAIVVPAIHDGGGVPAVARYLCEILSGHDCQIISISTAKNDAFSTRILAPNSWFADIQLGNSQWEGRSVIDVGAYFTELEFQRYMPRQILTDLLNQFDIVQIVAGAPAWAYIAKHVTKPVFLQVATLVNEERKNMIANAKGIKKLYLKLTTAIVTQIEHKAVQCVDVVFVENFWMKSHMEKLLGSSKVVLAPPGVDNEQFVPATAPNSGAKYLVSVGRLNDRRKNVHLLFSAYAQLLAINPDAPMLVLAGLSGPSDQNWAQAHTLGIKERILFKQDISVAELTSLLQNAELFVCSSDEEGLGIAMLEAMACGIPVVSTKCGGPEIFIRHGINGYLVENHNAAELAKHINNLVVDESLRRSFCKAAREDIDNFFSNSATSKIFLKKYNEFAV